jgi:S1-C subfamily serine protease
MNTNVRWGLATVACVGAAVAITWFLVRNNPATQAQNSAQNPDQTPAQAEDKVKIVVALSKALMQFSTQARPTILARLLDKSDLRTPGGKKIEIERVPMSSAEMVDGLLKGSVKAHIVVPSSDVYLDLLDREWTLRNGKPLTSDRIVVAHQPYILAVRRPMAEALGWPKTDVGWPEVIKVARDGWKTAGHPEWGSLKMLMLNPNYSDMGAHALVSIARGVTQKSKVTPADLEDPALAEALKVIDSAVVWFPSTIDDLLRNEILTLPSRCDMVFLAEHHLVALNDRSARRKAPPDWVGIYPAKGTVVDGVTAAVVQREWVTKEQREVAVLLAKNFMKPAVQKRLMSIGFRPGLKEIELAAPFTEAMGLKAKLPQQTYETPPVEVVLDCLAAWDKVWKARGSEVPGTKEQPAAAARPTPTTPVSMKKLSHLTPTIQCVRRGMPCTISILDPKTKEVRGTGVVVDARGYAVTNRHVVGGDEVVGISFLGGKDKVYKGKVLAKDPSQDLAIVRLLTPGKYPAIKYGNSSERELGETVIAIGNPLGYTGTVTVGNVSALDRDLDLPTGYKLTKVIQLGAGINPGNSGGPLLDIEGQLIGIVFAFREGAQNIGFAIPLDRVRAYVKKIVPQ